MEDIKIEDLWEAVNAKAERQGVEKAELTSLREIHEKLVAILPPIGKILTIKEFIELLKNIREILK